MNPEIIYSNFRDEALAHMFSADSYSTFVAMPFRGRYSYNPNLVLTDVIQKAAAKATEEKGDLLNFKAPATVLSAAPTANVITEDIVKSILFSTFFLAEVNETGDRCY